MNNKPKSVLYSCNIHHSRYKPIKRGFDYNVFMWYLDLDEIPSLLNSIVLASHNRFNYYSFNDKDHLNYNDNKSDSLRDSIEAYIKSNGESKSIGRIMILTNLTTFGYLFNPVSFYFCFDKDDNPLCAVAEVGNTYGEMKPFFLGLNNLYDGVFKFRAKKYFYVSPFIDHDTELEFHLSIPDDNLNIRINDFEGDECLLTASLKGKPLTLSNRNVLISAFKFPMITLKVIISIHYQALILWLKRMPYHKKEDHKDLQTGVYNKYQSKN